ncbi:thymopoietin a [Dunckerocampus dactyliophorus]|uniref:thymopoietin a n=1 Tax=Dunckerocampus dactyliophorus TaxID=161453 RepID=UPI002404C73D|nr:thymopoietin a [Dunckerocampus dactyliophorus]
MPEFMDDPSQLTKDKLKSELLAHNVELPSGNHTKDVYVQLYLKNLTAQNKQHAAATTLDAFSSDEELPPPVVSNRSRSSGKKAPRKTDKVLPIELDVTTLTDEVLREELLKHGVHAGPIVASTRQLYEKKLQKVLDDSPAQATITKIVVTEIQVNHNGNSESELYSDKEDDVIAEPEPEPVPVVEKPVRSRGKTPVTTRTRSSQHKAVEKIAASDETPKAVEKDVLKELYPNDVNSPLGITATCRRPIRGAAGRPVTSLDLWNDENSYFSPKPARSISNSTSSSYIESRIINRVNSPPTFSPPTFKSLPSTAKLLSATPPAGPTKVARPGMSWWKKVLLMAIGAAFLFFVYQAMETNTINPFSAENSEVVSGSKA